MSDLEWRRSVEQRLRELNQKTKPSRRAAVGGGGTSGAGGGDGTAGANGRMVCPDVEELPAIPTEADILQFVFWTSAGAGDGDDQVWWTREGLTRWYPMTYSTLDGTPGSTELGG